MVAEFFRIYILIHYHITVLNSFIIHKKSGPVTASTLLKLFQYDLCLSFKRNQIIRYKIVRRNNQNALTFYIQSYGYFLTQYLRIRFRFSIYQNIIGLDAFQFRHLKLFERRLADRILDIFSHVEV